MRRRIREFHASLWLDGLVAALGLAACVAALVLPPIVAMSVQGETTAVAVNLAYPAGDLLLVGLLVGALALTGWRPDRSITLLGVGVLLSAVGDLSYLDAVAHGTYVVPPWAASMWPASALLTAIAAWQPVATVRPLQLEGRRLLVLPLAAMIAALVLLFVDQVAGISNLAAGLALATLCVAAVRLGLTLGEHMALLGTSRGEATTDPLAGLWNRRALVRDLDDRMVGVSPERPLLLLLFDLNGFKAYNDVYGHAAGDALLSRLGTALTRAVDGCGDAYRMGGDEFCVLTAAPADQHADLAARTRAALSESGDGFAITAALGSATIDAPDSDPDDALLAADRRMYAEKNGLRGSAGGQSAAVLLRVLTERHPDLGEHVDSVAALTESVGLQLDMTDEDRTALWQAAALHDIGKAAVPDAILNKPGPLDEAEWAFMRRHTIIGERILDAAPALTAAARLVRASHERFDGAGTPTSSPGPTFRSAPASSRSATRMTRWSRTARIDRPCRANRRSRSYPLRRHAVRSRRHRRLRDRTHAHAGRRDPRSAERPRPQSRLAAPVQSRPCAWRRWRPIASSATAARRTPPVTMNFTEDSSASRSMPLEIEPMTSAPSSAPHTEPRPPNRLTPAITGPAMASSSRSPEPEDWLTASSREAARMPPNAASIEVSTNTIVRTRATLIPARRAASALPPTANTCLPYVVRVISPWTRTTRPTRMTSASGRPRSALTIATAARMPAADAPTRSATAATGSTSSPAASRRRRRPRVESTIAAMHAGRDQPADDIGEEGPGQVGDAGIVDVDRAVAAEHGQQRALPPEQSRQGDDERGDPEPRGQACPAAGRSWRRRRDPRGSRATRSSPT